MANETTQDKQIANLEVANGAFDELSDSLSLNPLFNGRGTANSMSANNPKDLITTKEQFLLEQWEKNGLARTFVCLPVDDALKGRIEIKASNFDDEANAELERLFNKYAKNEVKRLAYWARHFGGAGLIIISPEIDNQSTLNEPFAREGKNQEFSLLAVDRWRLTGRMGYEKSSIGQLLSSNNMSYTVGNKTTVYNQSVDKSRVITMHGDIAPIISEQKLSGWGYSVLEKVATAFDDYETCHKLIFDLMGQGMVNVVKIKNLMNSLRAGEFDHVVQFMQKSAHLKKLINTEVMDLDDERQQIQVSFAGFGDILRELRNDVAAKVRMPQTKLFGTATGGFSDGEDQIENYNSMVESTIRPNLEPVIQELCSILAFSYMGVDAGDIEIKFAPLREMKPEQEQDVKDKRYNRLKDQFERGYISQEEFQQKLERFNLTV